VRVLALVAAIVFASHASASGSFDDDSRDVLGVVLSSAVEQLIANWGITQADIEVVVSYTSSPCSMFPSREETRRVGDAAERASKGYRVSQEELQPAPPSDLEDLVTPKGHVIPLELVRKCLDTHGYTSIPFFRVKSPVILTFEPGAIIDRTFRTDPKAWETAHPYAVGVIRFSAPAFSDDGRTAAISYSRLRTGIGGGQFFCLLQKEEDGWHIAWQEAVLIE
jgi:hypothetical protein